MFLVNFQWNQWWEICMKTEDVILDKHRWTWWRMEIWHGWKASRRPRFMRWDGCTMWDREENGIRQVRFSCRFHVQKGDNLGWWYLCILECPTLIATDSLNIFPSRFLDGTWSQEAAPWKACKPSSIPVRMVWCPCRRSWKLWHAVRGPKAQSRWVRVFQKDIVSGWWSVRINLPRQK